MILSQQLRLQLCLYKTLIADATPEQHNFVTTGTHVQSPSMLARMFNTPPSVGITILAVCVHCDREHAGHRSERKEASYSGPTSVSETSFILCGDCTMGPLHHIACTGNIYLRSEFLESLHKCLLRNKKYMDLVYSSVLHPSTEKVFYIWYYGSGLDHERCDITPDFVNAAPPPYEA